MWNAEILMRNAELVKKNRIMELNFIAKSLQAKAGEFEREIKAEQLKVKRAIERRNTKEARFHAENAVRHLKARINYLHLTARLDMAVDRLSTHKIADGKCISSALKSLKSSLAIGNLQKLSETMDQFERQLANPDVKSDLVVSNVEGDQTKKAETTGSCTTTVARRQDNGSCTIPVGRRQDNRFDQSEYATATTGNYRSASKLCKLGNEGFDFLDEFDGRSRRPGELTQRPRTHYCFPGEDTTPPSVYHANEPARRKYNLAPRVIDSCEAARMYGGVVIRSQPAADKYGKEVNCLESARKYDGVAICSQPAADKYDKEVNCLESVRKYGGEVICSQPEADQYDKEAIALIQKVAVEHGLIYEV